mgnify:CR=1 FL=1
MRVHMQMMCHGLVHGQMTGHGSGLLGSWDRVGIMLGLCLKSVCVTRFDVEMRLAG